jgi:hypothetical protein
MLACVDCASVPRRTRWLACGMAVLTSLGALILLGGSVGATETARPLPASDHCQVRGERSDRCINAASGM